MDFLRNPYAHLTSCRGTAEGFPIRHHPLQADALKTDRELREQYQNYRFVCEQGGLIPNSRMMQLLGQETVNLANQNLGDDNLKSILLGKVLNECCKTLELKKNGLLRTPEVLDKVPLS